MFQTNNKSTEECLGSSYKRKSPTQNDARGAFLRSVWTLPPGFAHTTIIVGGKGINATMTRLGAALLKETGKIPVNPRNESFVLSHLGYWVDNGAP